MFYRRKIILALFEKIEVNLEKTRLYKLMFLLSQRQSNPNYDFVPYRFGCYSYSLKADLNTMVKKGWLSTADNGYELSTDKKYFDELDPTDKSILLDTINLYGKMSVDTITKHTYLNFPYFAINSTIAESILPAKYFEKVKSAKPLNSETVLYTIGYEGISLEAYLNKLIKNDIKLLIDVRRNPLSQKYGFSKKLLSDFCTRLNIDYIHIPEVGIDSSKRRELNSQDDYDTLFEDYKNTVLLETAEAQDRILQLLNKHKRVALTCFEADNCQCHRTHLAEKIEKSPTFKYHIKHL
ncbi:DUF488 family protein [Flagellimonas flava]|uniref:DUF488 domain-containing protein n=1 Tax=Flagellimonas flava TaxID=570519 RepID=UPI003D647764